MRLLYKSPRIFIREFHPSEEVLFVRFFENDGVTRFLPICSQKEYREFFRGALSDYKSGPFGRWGIFDTESETLIGNCLFRKFAEVPEQLEIGYSLTPKYWGKGLATETTLALVEYGFANTNSEEIVALTMLENIGSQKVLKKAGFKPLPNLTRKGLELTYYRILRPS